MSDGVMPCVCVCVCLPVQFVGPRDEVTQSKQ